jgi:hypothetical protein
MKIIFSNSMKGYTDKNYDYFSYNGFKTAIYLKWERMQMEFFLSRLLTGKQIFMWDSGILYDNKTL